ncbi:MAG: 3'-5' exonuclease [Cyanobacteria bacterium P01_G01_bin.54]
MTNLLIVDLETTGLDPQRHQPIELGAIFYSVEHACTLQQLSTLFPAGQNPAQAVNHISADASCEVLDDCLEMVNLFQQWVERADYLVAHNAAFDRQWFGQKPLPAIAKPWLCTYEDFLWPENPKPSNLITTALNHGIGVSQAHRALTDCQLIATLFDRVEYHQPGQLAQLVEQAIARSTELQVYVIAQVSKAEKDLAKQRGFRWERYLSKKWAKKMRLSDLEQEKADYPFKVQVQEISGGDR